MKAQFSLILASLILLSAVAYCQPTPALTDTFILGAYGVDADHFPLAKSMGFNLVTGNLEDLSAAHDLGLWMWGDRDWNQLGSYWGIQSLGSNTHVGKYYAATNHLSYPCFAESSNVVGTDVFVGSPISDRVRHVESSVDQPGNMMDNFRWQDFLPFYYQTNPNLWGPTRYYVRFYGRRLSTPQQPTELLQVRVSWMVNGQETFAYWGNGQLYGSFSSADFSTDWGITNYEYNKSFMTVSGITDPSKIKVYWTGAADLEIYQIIMSNDLGDQMVFQHLYDDTIQVATNVYMNSPGLARFFLGDEPPWFRIWALDYLSYHVFNTSGNTIPTTQSMNSYNSPYTLNLWADLIDENPELSTFHYTIYGAGSGNPETPNPYIQGTTFSSYDYALNSIPTLGLSEIVRYLTNEVWNARTRRDPQNPKPLWFFPQASGSFKLINGTWDWDLRISTPEEFRAVSNIGVACGARGIIPYLFRTIHFPTQWEVGILDTSYGHNTNWCNLDGVGDAEYVGWQSKYLAAVALNKQLWAAGPKLMQMQYQDSGYMAPLTDYIPTNGVQENGTPVQLNHIFLSSFTSPTSEPDANAKYFALVNRNCWPFDDYGDTLLFDIHTNFTSGTWYLEDLATHEFFKSEGNPLFFNDVPFAPGQGRVFRLAQNARWFGTTNVAMNMTVPTGDTLYVDANTTVNVSDSITITVAIGMATCGAINVGQGAQFKFGQNAGMHIHGILNVSGGSGANEEVKFVGDTTGTVWKGIVCDTALVTLTHSTVSNAQIGIKSCPLTSQLSLESCTVAGNAIGVYIINDGNVSNYGGLAINNSSIQNNTTYGVAVEAPNNPLYTEMWVSNCYLTNNHNGNIIFLDAAVPHLNDNHLANSNYGSGATCLGTSVVDFTPYNESGGYNSLDSNYLYGIKIADDANALLGDSAANSPGRNNFIGNGSYAVFNTSGQFIMAEDNYWGYADPRPHVHDLFYNVNRIDAIPYSTSINVRTNVLVIKDKGKPGNQAGFGEVGSGLDSLIQIAYQLLYSGQFAQAAPLFQQIIIAFPNQPQAIQALMGLYQAYLGLENLPGFLPVLVNLINGMPTGVLKENATYLESVVTRALGNSTQALALVQSLAQTATQANLVALSKFAAGRIYKYDLNQPAIGDSLMRAFIAAYPTGDLSTLAQVELGLINPPAGISGYGEPIKATSVVQLSKYDLGLPFPNPFNPTTVVRYQMPDARQVNLQVYNLEGRLVATLLDGWQPAGIHEVTFDGSRLASGLYFVRMQAGEFSAVRKMMLLK